MRLREAHMHSSILAFAGLALASAALPAAASIVIYDSPGALQPSLNVLFGGAPPPSGNNVFGITNHTNTAVTFLGVEPLTAPANGQARIEAVDTGLGSLFFSLTDPLLGFRQVEFNIFGTRGSATSVDLSFTDQFGNIFGGTYAIGNGENFFSAEAIDNQFIKSVQFTLNGDVVDARQFRIGGIGTPGSVPEPSNWAMLIIGFGLIGAASRRRRTPEVVAA
jgi:hypothetical protein